MTAAAIAPEAGIDDFIGQARPEMKLEAIRKYQKEGICGDDRRRDERCTSSGPGRTWPWP